MARGHSLAQALLSTSEDRVRGYYQGGQNGTYSRPVTAGEFEDFKKSILPELLAGSNKSEELLHFIATGNASPPTSAAQFRRGTQGADLPTAIPGHPESYFHEPPFRFPFKRLQGGDYIGANWTIFVRAEVSHQLTASPPSIWTATPRGTGLSGASSM